MAYLIKCSECQKEKEVRFPWQLTCSKKCSGLRRDKRDEMLKNYKKKCPLCKSKNVIIQEAIKDCGKGKMYKQCLNCGCERWWTDDRKVKEEKP